VSHGALPGQRVEIAAVGRPFGTAAAAPNAARP